MSNEKPATLNVDYEDTGEMERATFVLRCPVSGEYETFVSVTDHVEGAYHSVDAWVATQYSNGSLCITVKLQNRQLLTMIVKHAGQAYEVSGSAVFEVREHITASENIKKHIGQEVWKWKKAMKNEGHAP